MRYCVIRLKSLILILLAAVAAFMVGAAVPKAMEVFKVGERELPIYSVEREDDKIALTFDCAWGDEDIDDILKTLDEYGVKATFFVTGDFAERCGEAVRKIHDSGHEIGNHSYNHADYTKMSSEDIIADIEKADKVIKDKTGTLPNLVRAPSGGYNNTVVSAIENSGRKYIQWSVDGIDYGDADSQSIYDRCVKKAKKGDIILLHNGTKNTANILPKILEALECNYQIVPAGELIYKDNYILDNSGRQIQKVK